MRTRSAFLEWQVRGDADKYGGSRRTVLVPCELTGCCDRYAGTQALRSIEVQFPWDATQWVDPALLRDEQGELVDAEEELEILRQMNSACRCESCHGYRVRT